MPINTSSFEETFADDPNDVTAFTGNLVDAYDETEQFDDGPRGYLYMHFNELDGVLCKMGREFHGDEILVKVGYNPGRVTAGTVMGKLIESGEFMFGVKGPRNVMEAIDNNIGSRMKISSRSNVKLGNMTVDKVWVFDRLIEDEG